MQFYNFVSYQHIESSGHPQHGGKVPQRGSTPSGSSSSSGDEHISNSPNVQEIASDDETGEGEGKSEGESESEGEGEGEGESEGKSEDDSDVEGEGEKKKSNVEQPTKPSSVVGRPLFNYTGNSKKTSTGRTIHSRERFAKFQKPAPELVCCYVCVYYSDNFIIGGRYF